MSATSAKSRELSNTQAVTVLKVIDSILARHYVYQNKREGYRDLKWDYLDHKVAKQISHALTRARIPHSIREIESYRSGGTHWQIRLSVPLSFSVGRAREMNGGRTRAAKKAPRTPRQLFNQDLAQLKRAVASLRFGKRDHCKAATAALRAFEHYLT